MNDDNKTNRHIDVESTKTQQNDTHIDSSTYNDSVSSSYKIKSTLTRKNDSSSYTSQQSKFAIVTQKISESVKSLIAIPYNYILSAFIYAKDGIYSAANSAWKFIVEKRSSTQSKEQFIQKSLQEEKKSLAEQVTEVFSQQGINVDEHESCPIVKTEIGAPFSRFTGKFFIRFQI